ncbi:Vms1/Ankzf1 family peptidyl-tRNA hydrolase [Pilimelia columellifera]|uniref:Vms1/Ankzf1 family peptidyl-tRNA hydrolase n=1 Tax=Pilimelia columellifera subsp. columellifera TaxID=706583 RepID=A0ABN3MZL6_9ACTN
MDLSFLRPLYDRPGPWASAYLDITADVPTAPAERELRWRRLREQLVSDGADPGTVAALDDAILGREPTPGRHGLVVFASDGLVVMDETLPAPPPADSARWAPLPDVMPLLAARGEEISWLRVVADRTGADLEGVSTGGVARRDEVIGQEDFPIRKVKPGGWSSRRYQQAAEVTWQRNAGDVAAAADALGREIGAEILVVGGDVRAVQQFMEQLPAYWQGRVVRTEAGSRAPGADPEAIDEATAAAITDAARRHTDQVLDRFGVQLGQPELEGTGLPAVVAALQRGQAETVLSAAPHLLAEPIWIGPEATHLALSAEDLTAMGVENPQRDRADAALARAMAGTDAQLVMLDQDDAPGGAPLAVVLRYADVPTSS